MRSMARRLRTGLAAFGLLSQLALYPVGAQEPQIRDGYVPLDHCFPKKAGTTISHYMVHGERVGFTSDNFYGIMIPKEKADTPGLAISGLQIDGPYRIIISACDKEGNCKEDGYIVRQARARK
jgi:hypothetical protein